MGEKKKKPLRPERGLGALWVPLQQPTRAATGNKRETASQGQEAEGRGEGKKKGNTGDLWLD